MIKRMSIAVALAASTFALPSCNNQPKTETKEAVKAEENFEVGAEEFADLQLLRYQIPGFNELSLQQKTLAYYLYEAALSGRDMIYDQKDKNGILLRKTLENIYSTYNGDKNSEDWKKFHDYCGRFWFSNGNHHHYGNDKFLPECSAEYFATIAKASDAKGFPMNEGENMDAFLKRIQPLIFDKNVDPKCVDLRPGIDNIKASCNNFYEGVSQKEVEDFYSKMPSAGNAPSWGLNSKTMKENGKIVEHVWKVGGMYGAAIEKMVGWLEKAVPFAENDKQKLALQKLIEYYKTGDLKTWDDYNIAWVHDVDSRVDITNGFIEVYLDAIGKKASYESCLSIKDMEATKRIAALASNAQWFEDNSPIDAKHKKKEVKGITGKAITVIVECGDAAPSTPIGINLPNAEWIRKVHGSKSVSLTNIIDAYNMMSAKKSAFDEFGYDSAVIANVKKNGALGGDLHTSMHECIGHASGQINPGVETTDKTLKNYASCLEEARADLVGLYYIMDKKLIDIGVMPNMDVAKAEYDSYITNGLISQLTRLKMGDNLEEAHMRNRQLNAKWAYEHGKKDNVIEFVKRDGKTYVKINDYEKLRNLFGQLLKEIQRVKSEGDYKGGKDLVETYGVKVDQTLLKEVLERYSHLGLKPYKGFIQPRLVPVMDGEKITDVKVEYPNSFFDQMMEYGKKYSFLGVKN